MEFRHIKPTELNENPFSLIDKEWMLVASADRTGDGCGRDYNMMTASWGGLGILWNKPVAFVFIRPQRHTFTFTERNERMTLSFFGEEFRKALAFCGKYSGRDCDKARECSLTPVFDENGGRAVYFDEARLVLVTRKLYAQQLGEKYAISSDVPTHYSMNDYHIMYVCEIEDVLVADK